MTYYTSAYSGPIQHCQADAAETVWCPTWISAEGGPMHLCAEHAKGFKPEFNKHAADGLFFWGAQAHEQFKSFMRPLPFLWDAFRPLQEKWMDR